MFKTADLAAIEMTGRFAVNGILTDGSIVPDMVVSLAELKAMVTGGYAQVWCHTCTESVADCPRARERGVEAPREWSTMTFA